MTEKSRVIWKGIFLGSEIKISIRTASQQEIEQAENPATPNTNAWWIAFEDTAGYTNGFVSCLPVKDLEDAALLAGILVRNFMKEGENDHVDA